jgi:hypothetical protein
LPTFWRDEGLYGQDGKMGLDWLAGTEGGKELVRKDGEGLAFVCPLSLPCIVFEPKLTTGHTL